MRSLPFPRRLQLVKLLRAHGLRDVERLREDELKDALARLSILMPDVSSQAPYVTNAPSSQAGAAAGFTPLVDDDSDDPHSLPRFREARPFLPNGERTFVRAIAVKPRRLFCTWDMRWDLPDGETRLEVCWADTLGHPPAAADIARQVPALTVTIDRQAPGWYIEVPAERLAIVVRLVIDAHDGPVVVATSNMTLTPPARPAPPGPLWFATLTPDVDRRTLRGDGLLQTRPLPDGASFNESGEALPDAILAAATVQADPPSSSFRFLGHTDDDLPSSSSRAAKSANSSSSSMSNASSSSASSSSTTMSSSTVAAARTPEPAVRS